MSGNNTHANQPKIVGILQSRNLIIYLHVPYTQWLQCNKGFVCCMSKVPSWKVFIYSRINSMMLLSVSKIVDTIFFCEHIVAINHWHWIELPICITMSYNCGKWSYKSNWFHVQNIVGYVTLKMAQLHLCLKCSHIQPMKWYPMTF